MRISLEFSTPFKIIYTKSRQRSRTLSPDYKVGERSGAHLSPYIGTSKDRLRTSPSPIREGDRYLQPQAYESTRSEHRGRPRVDSHHGSHHRDVDKSRSSEKESSKHHRDVRVSSSTTAPQQYADKQGRGRQRSYSNVERGQVLRSCLKKTGTPSRGRSRSRVRFSDTPSPIPQYATAPPSPIIKDRRYSQESRGRPNGNAPTSSQPLRSPRQMAFVPPPPSTCGSCDDHPTYVSEPRTSRESNRHDYSGERGNRAYEYVYPSSPLQGYSATRHRTYDNISYYPLQAR
ncbi:hypothetical protein QCA50_014349 [Cerrena zonata]|uniref:Uncharacterized protein n=1 Tax=Cerrena zonata TaxID=2478898 RepID=A0AAW0FU51_9APHY